MYEKLTNNDLLRLVANKDANAFREVYYRFAAELLNIAYRKTGDRHAATDMVQELFIWFWEKAGSLSPDSNLRAYLYTAIQHRVYNYYHSRTRAEAIVVDFARSMPLQTAPDVRLEYHELQSMVAENIQAMPPAMQKIFLLSRQHNRSVHEIALLLRISEQTVKNQLTKATNRIRTALLRKKKAVLP